MCLLSPVNNTGVVSKRFHNTDVLHMQAACSRRQVEASLKEPEKKQKRGFVGVMS